MASTASRCWPFRRRRSLTIVYSETVYPRIHFGLSDLRPVDGRYHQHSRAEPELYDVAADPAERNNLAPARASTASSLAGWLARMTDSSTLAPPSAETADVRERLRALGYVASSAPAATPGAPLADPKDKIATYEALRQAQQLTAQGRELEAIGALQPLVAREPGMLDAWELLARNFVKAGRTKEAIAAFGKVLALEPLKPETHLAMARVYALDGQHARAREHAELAARRDPAAAYETLASLMMDEGRLADAAAFARRSVEADPSRYMSHFLIGVVAERQGRWKKDRIVPARDRRKQRHSGGRQKPACGLADCLARTDNSRRGTRVPCRSSYGSMTSKDVSAGHAVSFAGEATPMRERSSPALSRICRSRLLTRSGPWCTRSRCSATPRPRASGRQAADRVSGRSSLLISGVDDSVRLKAKTRSARVVRRIERSASVRHTMGGEGGVKRPVQV
jgi:tetratricopeptide (TPR) repeat protein